MTVEQLGSIAGIVLSLFLAYIPKINDWYAAQSAQVKAQVMGGLLVVSALAIFGLSCANIYNLVACSVDGAKQLTAILINALVANQAAYLMLVRPFKGK